MAISVVTGAAGFVGQALVRRLLADGDAVRAVVLPGDPAVAELRAMAGGERLATVEADVTDAASLAPALPRAPRAFPAPAPGPARAPPPGRPAGATHWGQTPAPGRSATAALYSAPVSFGEKSQSTGGTFSVKTAM